MKTSDLFKKEIEYIVNPVIQNIVREMLDTVPKYFQTIPASSSGKYHPEYAQGKGGLVRHTKAAVGIAKSMIDTDIFKHLMFEFKSVREEVVCTFKDSAYAALILHDSCKGDDTERHQTRFDHPLLAANTFKEIARKYITDDNVEYMKIIIPLIFKGISTHMGQWSTAPYAKGVILPEPQTNFELFVHMCDYLASRKCLEYQFFDTEE